jgi:uncharacterized protein (DUF1499 family)
MLPRCDSSDDLDSMFATAEVCYQFDMAAAVELEAVSVPPTPSLPPAVPATSTVTTAATVSYTSPSSAAFVDEWEQQLLDPAFLCPSAPSPSSVMGVDELLTLDCPDAPATFSPLF